MCGIFGIFDHEDAATITALSLHSLQHRGQESCGIVTHDKKNFYLEKKLGLVGDNFTKKDVIERLPGSYAIGHNRYSTAGGAVLRNIQPFFADLSSGPISIAHNGNLTNGISLREKLVQNGSIFQSTSDTEIIIQLIAVSKRTNFIDKLIDALFQIQGGFSLVVMTGKKLIGVRDPFGIRPLVLGDLDGSPILTSETCSLDIIGAKFIREIENGEIVVITNDGIKSIKPFPKVNCRPDIFEYIYFSRPDSSLNGKNIYQCRKEFGIQLAKESKTKADLVTAVPDSGMPAAIGYAEESKIPFELGLIRNHYVGRTFIEPKQQVRQFGVKLKHNANSSCIKNKRIILIDDSIVRGTTCLKIVKMLKDAGVKEIHMKVASPPITHPDYYGVDTPKQSELLAANKNISEMTKYIGVNTLSFLSIEGLYKSMGFKNRNSNSPQFTDHCFTGDYPVIPVDKVLDKLKHNQLSFLSNINI
ncbi:MAG: Amidophosphoribosyltransferase [Alphaproteobacteria bacterium MarineAlpha6_Bin1]|nr:MAG: Amidophosphoribosyltransferase [Alphaproteobacteria bacterium MarineAlpha6_Bin1]